MDDKNLEYTGELPWVLKGAYTDANLWIRTYDPEMLTQVYNIINCPAFEGQKVAIMSDAHVGASGPCGLVATIGDYICPEHIGVDIGCTVSMMILDKPVPEEKLAELEHKIRTNIPFGMNIYDTKVIEDRDFYKFIIDGFNRYRNYWPEMLGDLPNYVDEKWVDSVINRVGIDPARFWKSIGTVGGGNHFIEYDVDKEGKFAAFTFHFGSRNFGKKTCEYWMSMCDKKKAEKMQKERIKTLSAQFKESYKETHSNMKSFKDDLDRYLKSVQEENSDAGVRQITGYLSGDLMKGYLQDMCFAQLYAQYNHLTVQKRVLGLIKTYNIKSTEVITTTHNFVDLHDHCLRKSSIRAYEGEKIIIPFNMRDGIAVCEGKSNPDWLNSAPHGAGRILARREAKRVLSLEEFEETMKDIVTSSVCREVLDEAPMAYKNTDEICELILPTCNILYRLYPKINWKAVDGGDTAA